MRGEVHFLDTNVLVYLFDRDASENKIIAGRLRSIECRLSFWEALIMSSLTPIRRQFSDPNSPADDKQRNAA